MNLIIVRHGESVGNRLKVTQGHHDYELTEQGISEAKAVAHALKDVNFNFAYCSDLKRCSQTADEILAYHPNTRRTNLTILREQNKGIYETRPKTVMHKDKVASRYRYHLFKPKDGERLIDVYDKQTDFCKKMLSMHSEKNILVVSHGGSITCLLLQLLNIPIENNKLYSPKTNVATSLLKINSDKILPVCLNASIDKLKIALNTLQ
tara:strand:- start:784 stop:1404 length:621 start_codon:yes stop_codon:yes gene_type:complete